MVGLDHPSLLVSLSRHTLLRLAGWQRQKRLVVRVRAVYRGQARLICPVGSKMLGLDCDDGSRVSDL